MRKYLFLMAQEHPLGGSEMLWAAAAELLVHLENEVRVSDRQPEQLRAGVPNLLQQLPGDLICCPADLENLSAAGILAGAGAYSSRTSGRRWMREALFAVSPAGILRESWSESLARAEERFG